MMLIGFAAMVGKTVVEVRWLYDPKCSGVGLRFDDGSFAVIKGELEMGESSRGEWRAEGASAAFAGPGDWPNLHEVADWVAPP